MNLGQSQAGARDRRAGRAASLWLTALLGSAASACAFGGQWGPVPENQSEEDWVKNCLIYTTESVTLPGPFDVFAGANDPSTYRSDVCSLGTTTVGGNAQKATVPVEAPVQVDVAVVAPTINLQRASDTSECVFDTGVGGSLNVATNVGTACPVQRDLDLSVMPNDIGAVIPFPTITPAGDAVTEVLTGGTLALGPGNYGRIVLYPNATLQLTGAGEYHFKSIRTITDETRAFIQVDSARTDLYVEEYLLLGHRSQVNASDTRLLKVYVAGGDGWVFDRWTGPQAGFTFRGDAVFNACYVYSPNATQSWRGKPLRNIQRAYKTQSFGKAYFHDTTTAAFRVAMDHPQDPECFEPPIETEIICESKTLDPTSLSAAAGTVEATVTLFSSSGANTPGVIVRDTMDAPLSFAAGSALYQGSPVSASGGPPTWEFAPLTVVPGQSILTYDIDVENLGIGERACNTVRLFDAQDNQISQCNACVTRVDDEPARALCDRKIITPNLLTEPDAEVDVRVDIFNASAVAVADPVIIRDTMDPKMTYIEGSARVGDDPIGDPIETGSNTWTFPPQTLGPDESLVLSYRVRVSGIDVGELVSNNVEVSTGGGSGAGGLRAVATADFSTQQASESCSATVTRRGVIPPPDPTPIPAVGPVGLSLLTLILGLVGAALVGGARRGR